MSKKYSDRTDFENDNQVKEIPSLKNDNEVVLDEFDLSDNAEKQTTEIFDKEIAEQALKEAEDFEKPKKKKKNAIISVAFLALNIIIIAFLVKSLLKDVGDASLLSLFKTQGKNMWWLLAGLGLMAMLLLSDATVFFILIKKTTKKCRPLLSYKTTALGKYYESVTPLAMGCQPAQIYNLSKGNVGPGVAASLPIMRMMIYNIVNVVLGVVLLILIGTQIQCENTLQELIMIIFKILAYIGVIFNGILAFFIVIIANSKIIGKSLAKWVVRLGYKLRFVKDYRKTYDKLMRQVIEFQNSMVYIKKNKSTLLCMIGCNLLTMLSIASMPFILVLAYHQGDAAFVTPMEGFRFWLECLTRYYICYFAASYIPLPGGTGMLEISFVAMFGSTKFFGENVVWGLLTFRIFTYYLIILQGFLFVIVGTIKNVSSGSKMLKNKNLKLSKKE